MSEATERRRAQCRAAQRRYNATDKGRATIARYRTSPKGRAKEAEANARLLRAGATYIGKAATAEQGRRLQSHIKERLLGFKQRFATRAEAEGISEGTVPPQTKA